MSLLENVHANPDDDGPRRVLADALLERGDVRGEFIALQLELARVLPDERTPAQLRLAERERELLDAHGVEWLGPWPVELLPEFERGFPFHQRGRAAELATWWPELLSRAPTLSAVTLTDDDPPRWGRDFWLFTEAVKPGQLARLALPVTFRPADARPLAALEVPALSFSGWVGDEGARELGLCRELTLTFDVGVRDFSPFGALESLVNSGNPMNVTGAQWPKLRRFTLEHVEWRGRPTEWWPKLERLELFDCKLGRRGVHELLAAGHPTVKRLGIRKERIEPADFALLERWPALEVLDIPDAPNGPVVSRLRRLSADP